MEVVETFFTLNGPERSEGPFRVKNVKTTSKYLKKMHYYIRIPKKKNIKHFLNRPYIGIFMSLLVSLCFWVSVCVLDCYHLVVCVFVFMFVFLIMMDCFDLI